jgi:hypothetical protein
MQLADHRLEVEPCRCRARLLHRCFVVSHTHTTPPKTTPDANNWTVPLPSEHRVAPWSSQLNDYTQPNNNA